MKFSDFCGRPNNNANHQAVTISTTVQTLAQAGATIDAQTQIVRVTAELADVRYVMHGATNPDPSTNVGDLLFDGEATLLSREQFDLAKWKRNAGTDAKLQIQQYLS